MNGVTNPLYHYDANGNMDCVYTGTYPAGCTGGGASRAIAYNSFNMTASITQATTTVTLKYGPDHDRLKQVVNLAGATTSTVYFNDAVSGASSDLTTVTAGPIFTWHDYITVGGALVAMRSCVNATSAACTATPSWSYFVTDHLGSVATVTNAAGGAIPQLRRLGPTPQPRRHRQHNLLRHRPHDARLHRPRAHREHLRDQRQCADLRSDDCEILERGLDHPEPA